MRAAGRKGSRAPRRRASSRDCRAGAPDHVGEGGPAPRHGPRIPPCRDSRGGASSVCLRVPPGRPTLRAAGLLIAGSGLGAARAYASKEILVWFASSLLARPALVGGWTVPETASDRRLV